MDKYSGWQYLLIDIGNHFGLDKKLFGERIQWVEDNLPNLEQLIPQAECKPLYIKAVMALRKAQAKQPTGHLVGLDACCSGIQVMSALTGCIAGATATGLVDPTVRADAYSKVTEVMRETLGSQFDVSRNDAKDALMTSFYGSKEKPKQIFGEDSPELNAFYLAAQRVAPGAWDLLQDLLASWQPYALVHEWKLPDGFDARVKVMQKVGNGDSRSRIEVDELDHATFTYEYYVNEGSKKGLSNVANVVHSVDAYILRCIHRRCNYNVQQASFVRALITEVLANRETFSIDTEDLAIGTKLEYYVQQYKRSGMADVVVINHIYAGNVNQLTTQHLVKLRSILDTMLIHVPFEVVTVHDEFKCHGNNMNHLRQHYINIFAELAESNVLSDILSQIHGKQGTYPKLSNNLGELIRGSNYALS